MEPYTVPEGLYISQVARVLFGVAMIGLFIRLSRSPLIRERGWRFIRVGACLFFWWSLNTFLLYFSERFVHPLNFTGHAEDWSQKLIINDAPSTIFYITGLLDPLLVVSATFFIFLGLRKLRARREVW
ncbi:hypothetical protein LR007_04750 [candidate division NPL-UPA2 bacterium]|nr:hypothetical protein [candidate division NPL-UPA2 bacterium]